MKSNSKLLAFATILVAGLIGAAGVYTFNTPSNEGGNFIPGDDNNDNGTNPTPPTPTPVPTPPAPTPVPTPPTPDPVPTPTPVPTPPAPTPTPDPIPSGDGLTLSGTGETKTKNFTLSFGMAIFTIKMNNTGPNESLGVALGHMGLFPKYPTGDPEVMVVESWILKTGRYTDQYEGTIGMGINLFEWYGEGLPETDECYLHVICTGTWSISIKMFDPVRDRQPALATLDRTMPIWGEGDTLIPINVTNYWDDRDTFNLSLNAEFYGLRPVNSNYDGPDPQSSFTISIFRADGRYLLEPYGPVSNWDAERSAEVVTIRKNFQICPGLAKDGCQGEKGYYFVQILAGEGDETVGPRIFYENGTWQLDMLLNA